MRLAIMGSTGSIGTQALDMVRGQDIEVVALTCGANWKLLLTQYQEFKPKWIVIDDLTAYKEAVETLALEPVKVLYGISGLIEVAKTADYDVLLTSVVGAIGLEPTVEAVKRGKRIALANKETLVVYGEVIMKLAQTYGSDIVPVDSEHSALFQALQGNDYNKIERIVLTASGGPFFGKTHSELKSMTKNEALKHPKWNMGAKISIDSATLMNKGLEVIEAKWLFDISVNQVEVVVHPQSIIHSIVEYCDGSMMAQMGLPDMRLPIHYALHYPKRIPTQLPRLNLSALKQMTFFEPDKQSFPCLELAYEAIRNGGSWPCVLNAANEILVQRYLNEEIGFYDIPDGIDKAMKAFASEPLSTLSHILEVDQTVRHFTAKLKF